jgi:hypothetical protein
MVTGKESGERCSGCSRALLLRYHTIIHPLELCRGTLVGVVVSYYAKTHWLPGIAVELL